VPGSVVEWEIRVRNLPEKLHAREPSIQLLKIGGAIAVFCQVEDQSIRIPLIDFSSA